MVVSTASYTYIDSLDLWKGPNQFFKHDFAHETCGSCQQDAFARIIIAYHVLCGFEIKIKRRIN